MQPLKTEKLAKHWPSNEMAACLTQKAAAKVQWLEAQLPGDAGTFGPAWTVEMLLIFTLGRPDILPVSDYGVRKGSPSPMTGKIPARRNCTHWRALESASQHGGVVSVAGAGTAEMTDRNQHPFVPGPE